jgi:hypothetical protein
MLPEPGTINYFRNKLHSAKAFDILYQYGFRVLCGAHRGFNKQKAVA